MAKRKKEVKHYSEVQKAEIRSKHVTNNGNNFRKITQLFDASGEHLYTYLPSRSMLKCKTEDELYQALEEYYSNPSHKNPKKYDLYSLVIASLEYKRNTNTIQETTYRRNISLAKSMFEGAAKYKETIRSKSVDELVGKDLLNYFNAYIADRKKQKNKNGKSKELNAKAFINCLGLVREAVEFGHATNILTKDYKEYQKLFYQVPKLESSLNKRQKRKIEEQIFNNAEVCLLMDITSHINLFRWEEVRCTSKKEKKTQRAIEEKILSTLEPTDKDYLLDFAVFLVALFGLRPGEVVALQYKDFSFRYMEPANLATIKAYTRSEKIKDYIKVPELSDNPKTTGDEPFYVGNHFDGFEKKTYCKLKITKSEKDGKIADTTKTGHDREIIEGDPYLDRNFFWILLKEDVKPDDYIFKRKNGPKLTANDVSEHLKEICTQSEIPPRPATALRKSFCTRYLITGASNAEIIAQMGHVDIKTSDDHYKKFYQTSDEEFERVKARSLSCVKIKAPIL